MSLWICDDVRVVEVLVELLEAKELIDIRELKELAELRLLPCEDELLAVCGLRRAFLVRLFDFSEVLDILCLWGGAKNTGLLVCLERVAVLTEALDKVEATLLFL